MAMNKLLCLVLAGTLPLWAHAEETPQLKDETARINYSLGYQIGNDFKKQGLRLNSQAMLKGLRDALAGARPMMDPGEMHQTLVELKRKVVTDQRENRRQTELADIAADKRFVEVASKKAGMKKTASGLLYRIVRSGEGKRAVATDTVTVNYRGTLTNGKVFDSSYRRGKPASFRLNGVIKGWTEGLQLIKAGGKITLIIPPNLAYGDRGPLAHRTLVFDVELLSVDKSPPKQTQH